MIVNFFDKCFCNHHLGCHTSQAPYDANNNIPLKQALFYKVKYGCSKCSTCKGFTLNNLQYLEYKYDQRVGSND